MFYKVSSFIVLAAASIALTFGLAGCSKTPRTAPRLNQLRPISREQLQTIWPRPTGPRLPMPTLSSNQ